MFQIRLMRVGDCQLWTGSIYSLNQHNQIIHTLYDVCYNSFNKAAKASSFRRQIEDALIDAVESRCKCHFPHSHLLNGSFHCQSSSTHVTYRNTLIGTYNFNATQLLSFIQDWVSSGASVKVDWYSVGIDKHCPVAIASLNERECGHEMCGDPRYHRARHVSDFDMPPCFDTCNCLL